MTRITVIGGSGDVGALVLPSLSARHSVRVADLRAPRDFDGEYVPADVHDSDSLAEACADTDVLVYLAMGPKQNWGAANWAREQISINVSGLYSALREAAGQGVKRFVHASTGSIFSDYLATDLPEVGDAVDAYGLSKAMAEIVCDAAVREHDLSGISLRLIGPVSDEEWAASSGTEHSDVITAGSDVARAFLAAVESDSAGYHRLMVSGDHTNTLIDSRETTRRLGWRPLARRRSNTLEETS